MQKTLDLQRINSQINGQQLRVQFTVARYKLILTGRKKEYLLQ